MSTDARVSSRPDLPSTLGGTGWSPRRADHRTEVSAGRLWSRCGYRSEVAPLREVLLARPPDSLASITAPGAHLMTAPVDLGRLRAEAEAVAEAYRAHGVTVRVSQPPPRCPPNVIFQRDLFLVTPEGAVLGRTASAQRAGEERYAAAALAEAGIPVLHTVRGDATFEGADALWVDEHTVLVGCGFRTNQAGMHAVREVLAEQGAEVLPVSPGPGVQHLLGALMLVDHRRALLNTRAVGTRLRDLLRSLDYDLLDFEPDDEVVNRRSLNVVTLRPGHVLMPSGCPRTRRRLETAGVEVSEVEVGEYVKAAGALGCLTGILRREADGRTSGER
ncbi:dimethylarginine dimethylaminohydrolase family protein [[Kitasatospora] papulosa]|uniref:dimethylarginine dimethylaminohydrolase family protein n=1 Tax=[Kitasatospora] papulosa TaxID=1464011 RepID=UPI00368E84F4